MSIKERILDLLFPPRCPFCGSGERGQPGEACPKCRKATFWIPAEEQVLTGEHFVRGICAGWYQDELRQSVLRFKFRGKREYAKDYGLALAKPVRLFLPGAYEIVTWMPVSRKRLAERGYDQSRLIAETLAEALGKPALPLLEKIRDRPPQSSLTDARARRENAAGAYAVPDPSAVMGRRVLLVDDILTTGATMEEGARILRAAGAPQVVAAALCRTPEKE